MLIGVAIVFGAIALFCSFLYVRQDGLIFYPRPNDAALREQWQWRRTEINSGDHVLEGWWAEGGAPDSSLVILYFGGNAEDVLYTASSAVRFAAKRMLVVNYRGYGNTQGRPSQTALYADALAVYDYAVDAGGADASELVVMGRSLGSGVASMLAAERQVRAAVLITPYDSIAAIASRQFPPFIVTRLLRHPFPSTQYAARANAPALLLAAADDQIIPPVHALELAKHWAGPHEMHVLEGVGHNTIEQHANYDRLINQFLERSKATPSH
jgi:uncharacterized protein